VLDYCEALVEQLSGDERRQRLTFWGTLALMRCVSSSPAAAAQALRTRARGSTVPSAEEEELLEEQVFDGRADSLTADDLEPAAPDGNLAGLIARAEALVGHKGDPKLQLLIEHLDRLIDEGFSPVVFCRYIRDRRLSRAAAQGPLAGNHRGAS